ncbi:P-type conjugative transfer protein TrbL [Vibrio parahaemolyticus]|nr:P-type conjugative transfer protein TrbL [Vibrio parahaemolyticus]
MSRLYKAALLGVAISLYSTAASAQLTNQGMLDQVVTEFASRASTWSTVIMNAATWLFWTLGTISLAYIGGTLILRKADIQEFFAEFVRFILFFGFYLWLLRNGPDFASDIIKSLQRIGEQASGVSSVTPSGIVDIGFMVWKQAISNLSAWSPIDSFVGVVLSAGILILLAVIAVNMLLMLVAAWMLMYAGVFFLGFGGSRWTSDMAINYFKTVLGQAAQIMTMVLLIGIGNDLLSTFYNSMSKGTLNFEELGVMLVFCIALLMLIDRVPPLVSGIITGSSVGAAGGIGNFGAGAAMGAAMAAAGMAAAGAKMAGGAALSGAANAVGGADAIKAAFTKAQSNMSGGDMPNFGGGSGDTGSDWGGSDTGSDNVSTGDTPFAQAAGFGGASSGATGGGFGRAASLVAGTAGELAKGAGSQMAGKFQNKVNQTAGGRLASSIRESMETKDDAGAGDKESDRGGASDSSPSFDSDSLSGGNGGGWVNQTGGFDALSSEDQDKARQSHAEWQARDPEKHTFDVGDYVSYAQERQQERNEEVASFVNRGQQAT